MGKNNKCNCGDPDCKRKIIGTKYGKLYSENDLTCGNFKKLLEMGEKYEIVDGELVEIKNL